ncbi:hypothetical protein [Actinoplanes sp. L3-i22]|uniref:hypothetical protein n=1 Tax=Actinoplanes sp. L3-i22 TaxID=2836373 RepID=UPI001C74BDF3|nr:hypothetical protein [Actinoplanes sp. L3-i22]BCY07147.1 hypothetical protein L3i22_022350 [Actinoplanes sp. L3-i22]
MSGLLEAGAILAGPGDPAVADVMTARAYRHPALAGRTVVRLVGATTGEAEDLSLEFLGFAAAGAAEVGHGMRRGLGFPAWALVHDPANAGHALALVKEMARLARVARVKPGTARDGYAVLAGRLGVAAPQLLPTFWEQAGRAYLAADNPRAAGTCFAEARRAEQAHGLVVDEERVRDVHLEFALAGALTAGLLSAYARDVGGRKSQARAYELVKALSLRRVAGGLPPHGTMAADLNRLAAAAGLDAEREADEVAALLLTYPATARGPAALWRSYRKSLIRLGQRDARVRARLLEILPNPPFSDFALGDLWLEVLEATGALAGLIDGSAGVPAAGWLTRFRRRRLSVPRSALFALVERLAPRLVAEGGLEIASVPVAADLELLDLCRSLGVPARIGPIGPAARLVVPEWAPGGRDLTTVAADPVLRPLLRDGVRRRFGRQRGSTSLATPPLPEPILRRSFGAAGVRDVLAELVDEAAGATTLGALDDALVELCALWSPAGVALAPDGFRRLLAVDLPAVLARSLRAGLLAELTWPAYEAAASGLIRPEVGTAWPELLIHDGSAARIVAPDGRITEHVFPFPAHTTRECTFVDGDLLVIRSAGGQRVAYWTSRPNDVFTGHMRDTAGMPDALPVPGGGLTIGAGPLRAGEPRALDQESYRMATDGRAYWRCEWHEDAWRWREFDPRTGEGGRFSVPEFFAVPGVVPALGRLRPVPPEFAGSPLGARDGLTGWRVTEEGELLAGEGIDGRRVTLPQRHRQRDSRGNDLEMLVGALLLPGATEPLAVTRVWGHPRGEVRLWTADGRLVSDEPDVTGTVPPVEWWHAMRPRDEAGSAALRALTRSTAAALLDADDSMAGPEAKHLPEVTDPVLRARIAAVVARAVTLRRRIAEIAPLLEPVAAIAPTAGDSALRLAWDGLCTGNTTYYRGRAGSDRILEQIQRAGAMLAEPETADAGPLSAVSAQWTSLVAGFGALALRAASPLTGDDRRAALAVLLGAVAGTPLDGTGHPVQVYSITQERMPIGETYVLREGSRTTLMFAPEHDGSAGWRRTGIQVAPDGEFGLPAEMTVRGSFRPGGRLAGDRLREFLRLLADRGPAPWRPAAAAELVAATGMARSEAVLLLAGLPGIARAEADFLTPVQRRLLGLASAQAKTGRRGLRQLSLAERVALLDAAMPVEPGRLWDEGPDVAAIAEVWIGLRGRRAAVPEDLVIDLGKVIGEFRAAPVLQAIAAPAPGDWLSTDERTVSDQGVPFDGQYLADAAVALPWLAYHLAADDPVRAALPAALRLVRDRLRNPDLLVGHGSHEAGERPEAGPALVDGVARGSAVFHHVAPSRLSGIDDPAIGFVDEGTATALRTVLSEWIDAVVAVPGGVRGYLHDPRISVPDLVGAVRERHRLGADAAAYYLQLLALPDPGDRSVQKWTGWSVKALREAQRALTEAGLVVAAKRARAGRPVFLPGGWQAARAPRLPVETWKISMYGGLPVPPTPVPRLFRTAWARVTDGDVPRFHDLEETR